jgi:hypothetical protein
MCLEPVKQYGYMIKYVKKQREEICRLAILENKMYNYQYLEPKFKEIFSYL